MTVAGLLRGVFAIVASIGALLAGAVHAAAIAGVDVEVRNPEVWHLHWSAMAIVLPALLLSVPRRSGGYKLSELIVLVPMWARVLVVAGLVNALASFVFVIPQTGGIPEQGNGRYAFRDHGVVREVSESEFHARRALTLQGFSSVWLYLFLTSALYLLTARRAT